MDRTHQSPKAQLLLLPNKCAYSEQLNRNGGLEVRRIDGYFLYQVGAALRPLITIKDVPGVSNGAWRLAIWEAERWLRSILVQEMVSIKTSRAKGWQLHAQIVQIKEWLDNLNEEQLNAQPGFIALYNLSTSVAEFQTLLGAELSIADMYVVSKKGGYDITELAENGLCVFPATLGTKVPDAITDAAQAARCIAFELPTAAAFHLHLVLERVMRCYYDSVTGNKPRPENRKIASYIDSMKAKKVGDQKIFAALSDIARFHRNPVLHPDEKLDSTEDAVALLGSIYSATLQMLKVIPEPELKLVAQDAQAAAA